VCADHQEHGAIEVDQWHTKFPDSDTRHRAMCNFGHTDGQDATPGCDSTCMDSVGMIKAEMLHHHACEKTSATGGAVECVACLLAMVALLTLKTQMTAGKAADEKELIAFVCLLLGLFLPMLRFAMWSGPMQYIAHIGASAQETPSPGHTPSWTGFGNTTWHTACAFYLTIPRTHCWYLTAACDLTCRQQ
jgi:hypothetical protein